MVLRRTHRHLLLLALALALALLCSSSIGFAHAAPVARAPPLRPAPSAPVGTGTTGGARPVPVAPPVLSAPMPPVPPVYDDAAAADVAEAHSPHHAPLPGESAPMERARRATMAAAAVHGDHDGHIVECARQRTCEHAVMAGGLCVWSVNDGRAVPRWVYEHDALHGGDDGGRALHDYASARGLPHNHNHNHHHNAKAKGKTKTAHNVLHGHVWATTLDDCELHGL